MFADKPVDPKNIAVKTRLSAKDLAVVLSISTIGLLAIALLFPVPILPLLAVIILTATAIIIYGRLKDQTTLLEVPDSSAADSKIELAAQAILVDKAHSLRSDFLANASHELKTPVASLLGYIETLQGHAKDDPVAREKFLGIMQSQAERMQRLINDLLSLRRIEQIEHIAPNETADLQFAVNAAMETVQPLATKRRVNIKYIAKGKAHVTGHHDELTQLVINLLDNAVKISDAGAEVELTVDYTTQWDAEHAFTEGNFSGTAHNRHIVLPTNTQQSFYILKIRDYGPGFSADHLPRIGERFYRIAGDLSSQEKGTGLGLAIVKHITRQHRGGLLIQSIKGEGTEFTVVLPAANSQG